MTLLASVEAIDKDARGVRLDDGSIVDLCLCRRVFGPVVLIAVAAVPAAGAIGLAYLMPGQ